MKTYQLLLLTSLCLLAFTCIVYAISYPKKTYNTATIHWHKLFPGSDNYIFGIYLKNNLKASLHNKYSYELSNLKENTNHVDKMEAFDKAGENYYTATFN